MVQRQSVRPAAIADAIVDLKTQGFDLPSEVVNHILPSTSGFQHGAALGEAEGFANQTPIHVAHGQMRPLDIGSVLPQLSRQGIRLALDHSGHKPEQASVCVTLLGNLHILPILPWLLLARWAATPLIGRNLPVDFQQGFPMSAPAIGNQSWRVALPAAPFEHGESLL
jgi:hypothetical protein